MYTVYSNVQYVLYTVYQYNKYTDTLHIYCIHTVHVQYTDTDKKGHTYNIVQYVCVTVLYRFFFKLKFIGNITKVITVTIISTTATK